MSVCPPQKVGILVAGIGCTLERHLRGPPTVHVPDVLVQGLLIHRLVLTSGESAWNLRTWFLLARPRLEFLLRRRNEVGIFFKLALVGCFNISLHLVELASATSRLGCDEIGKASLTERLTGGGQSWEASSTLNLCSLFTHVLDELSDGRVSSTVVQNEALLVGVDHGSLAELTDAEAVIVSDHDPPHHEASLEDVLVFAAVIVELPERCIGDVVG